MSAEPKFPDIEVELTGGDGNGFLIACRVRTALKRGGAPAEDQEAFFKEALSGNYDHLLQTCMAWVSVT